MLAAVQRAVPKAGNIPPTEGTWELSGVEKSPCAADDRAELQRVMNSVHFSTSDRNRRFLDYVIEETLAGRAERLKAYTIATMVFGRPESFDPQLDPVVRIEARRLRRALERFYLIEGEDG